MCIFRNIFLAFLILCGSEWVSAQTISYSLPTKLQYGVNRFDILGRNTQGIVMQESSRTQTTIEVFTTDMKLKWRKNLSLKELGASVQRIFLLGDSSLIFYSHFIKGKSVLKVIKTNDRFELPGRAIIVDSTNVYNYVESPEYSFALSNDKANYLIYFSDEGTASKNKTHAIVIDKYLNILSRNTISIQLTEQPRMITALVDDSANTYFLAGDSRVKNFRNNFAYLTFQLYYYNDSSKSFFYQTIYADGKLMTAPIVRMDWLNHRIILTGLYANNPGVESKGIYYLSFQTPDCKVLQNKFIEFSDVLLSSLSGNNPPRRSDGFFNFRPQEMIVKNDGGVIFFTEAVSVSSESFANPGYGGIGFSTSLTVNFYHYDEILTTGFTPDGAIEWQKIYPKKQQTEGDEGYYSSYSIFIGVNSLSLFYNDFIAAGITNLVSYKVNTDGSSSRKEIFNSDKKGLLPVCQFGKQISSREFIIPSIKRGYLQFIKITF